ncbi:MAG TPA: D-alanine--D-alanine ligase [Thermoanaerobaculia bacterium]|nr:D-alanine--D-alanine ligase [Thermoanaerobaculia bacterium]
MHIGLTYDLREEYLALGYGEEETAELDQPGTIDALEETLRSLGHRTERIGRVDRLMERLLRGDRWDLVFNIAEGIRGLGREALVPALLDHYGVPYTFSDPLVLALTLHKGMTKHVVRDAGVPTPDFVVVEDAERCAVSLPFPLFVKPIGEGTGKGVDGRSIVKDQAELEARCRELISRFRQPALVEELLPGRELTVGILGTGDRARAVGTLEVILLPGAEPGAYSYVNKERCEELVEYRLVHAAQDAVVAEAEAVALAAWRALGCRDGGRVDLRCDRWGHPSFMEVNPLAGLHPLHSDLPILSTLAGLSYPDLIDSIVRSAAVRVQPRVARIVASRRRAPRAAPTSRRRTSAGAAH